MSTQFDSGLQSIRSRIKALLWLHGLSWLSAVLIGGLLGACLADWLLHMDDPVIRILTGTAVLAATCWVAWTKLLRPLGTPLSDLDIARKIEGRFPQFRDSLTSSVQFAADPDNARIGSPEMQRHVVNTTLQQVQQCQLADVLTAAPLKSVACGAGGLLATAILLAGLNQADAAIAIQRFLFPFTAGNWPRECELQFVDAQWTPIHNQQPTRAARGVTLDLYVHNINGRMPQDAHIEYRYPDGHIVSEHLNPANLVDHMGRTRPVATARIRAVAQSLEFRAVGGDHRNMPWHQLRVLPLPQVERLSVRLIPPEYSRQPARQLAAGVGHISGLVGTRVTLKGRANMNLQSATLKIHGQAVGRLQLSANQRNFTGEFTIPEAGVYSYVLNLQDRQGLENRDFQRYEIRGIADRVPQLTVIRPASDILVTPTADLLLMIQTTDDLGLRSLAIVHRDADAPAADPQRQVLQEFDHETESTSIHIWQLSTLQLTPGRRLAYHFEASDYCDLVDDHVGTTPPLVLRVVSPSEKRDEIGERLNQLVEEMQRLLTTQTQARDLVRELRIQLATVGTLQQRDVDLLKRVEFDQRHISSSLLNKDTGIRDRSQALIDELAMNHLVDPGLLQHLERIVEEVTVLETEFLPPIQHQLTRVRKVAVDRVGQATPAEPPPADPVDDSDQRLATSDINTRAGQTEALTDAIENQTAVMDVLENLLSAVSESQREQSMTQALAELIQQQMQLNQQTTTLGARTLTRAFDDLPAQDQSDLARLATRQQRQAEALQAFHNQLSTMTQDDRPLSSASQELVREMLDQMHDQALLPRSRELIPLLETNRIGAATRAQQRLLDDLRGLDDLLSQRESTDTQARIRQLLDAERTAMELKQRAEDIRRQTQAAAEATADDSGLSDRQQALRDDTRRLSRQLRRLQAERATQSARRAARQMRQADARLQDNTPRQALEPQQEAIDDLEQTRSETALARRQAEDKLARETMQRLQMELLALQKRQQQLITESGDMQRQYLQTKRWTRPHLKTLIKLASDQETLKADTSGLLDDLRTVEVVRLVLQTAVDCMQTATERIRMRRMDDKTIAWQARAKQKIADLLKALEPDQTSAETNSQQGTAGQQQEPSSGSPEIDRIQLRLLIVLQQDLNARVVALDAIRKQEGQLDSDQQAELLDIGQQQAEIATLARGLLKTPAEDSQRDEN